ncbi:sensor histidine kinase [Neobacillus rhizophilus]|uniref:histidine kinase n=1 Tax=Neobacillus rhizophilus TaxID=2833579 RepID=A0A942YW04_9BACI|nr:sensor histidine kinase [Neobacillus rhizophilus]MBS4214604.1 sensor histidine kinase [Neobacillus rhizophilus]
MKKTDHDWIWVDWFIFFLRLCWYLSGILYFYLHMEDLGGKSFFLFVGILTVSYIVPHIFWRPGYKDPVFYPIAELIVAGGASIYFNIVSQLDLGASMVLMPILMIGFLATKQTAKWTYPLFFLGLPIPRLWTMDTVDYFLQYIDIFIFFGFGACFNYVIQSRQKTKRIIEENHKQYQLIQEQYRVLQQYAEQIEKVTLLQERNRLAQELHDTIGHHFTSVTVGLDAISYLLETDVDKAKQKIEMLANVSRKGLEDIRKNIHQIAPAENDEPLSFLLHQIADNFKKNTDTDVQFHMKGKEFSISKNIKLVFIRCLQEALTNAKRHGGASEIIIDYIFSNSEIVLIIENNGTPIDALHPGFGITAMKERIGELQGNLEISSGEHCGVKLTITVPIKGVA